MLKRVQHDNSFLKEESDLEVVDLLSDFGD